MIYIGLGNPGSKYEKNRHNLGAIVVEQLAQTKGSFSKQHNALIFETKEIIYALPQTFMNLSGDSVQKILQYFKKEPKELVVFHDETELLPTDVKYKWSGGHKGHNGLRDIFEKIHTAEFHRIRLGVGRPDNREQLADYVLSNLQKNEYPDLETIKNLLKHEIWKN